MYMPTISTHTHTCAYRSRTHRGLAAAYRHNQCIHTHLYLKMHTKRHTHTHASTPTPTHTYTCTCPCPCACTRTCTWTINLRLMYMYMSYVVLHLAQEMSAFREVLGPLGRAFPAQPSVCRGQAFCHPLKLQKP